jgi:kynurenine formamidase
MHDHVSESLGREVAQPTRRDFLKTAGLGVGALGAAATGLAALSGEPALVAQAQAQAAGETPVGARWWPSRWGAEDQAGASNHITPQKILETVQLIRTGKVYEIGRVYEAGMRRVGSNQVVWHDEFLATEIGQVGTQFDGLGHIGVAIKGAGNKDEMRFYNGFPETEVASPNGLKKLGIENVKAIFTRGLLFDIAGLKGRALNQGEEVTVADLTAALQRQNVAADQLRPGDAAFIHTGKFNAGEPGIGLPAARWLAERQVCVVGADTWGVEAVPNPDANLAFPCHQELITKNGIFLHENLDLGGLAADRVYQFAYVMTPLRIKGATGSPGRPVAIV